MIKEKTTKKHYEGVGVGGWHPKEDLLDEALPLMMALAIEDCWTAMHALSHKTYNASHLTVRTREALHAQKFIFSPTLDLFCIPLDKEQVGAGQIRQQFAKKWNQQILWDKVPEVYKHWRTACIISQDMVE